nr:thiol-activated cytolysin family protein [Candidatus Krumholzibacteria bacterium]
MNTHKLPLKVLLLALTVMLWAGCSSEDNPTKPGPGAADVDEYMRALPSWAEFSPQMSSENILVSGPVDSSQSYNGTDYDCEVSYYSITETPEEITVFSPDSEIMWLGSLLQGQAYAGGLGSLGELPIRQRAPLTIFIDLLTDDVTRTVEDPDPSSMAVAIGDLIQLATNSGHVAGSSIFFDQKTTYSLEQAALDLNISVNYLGNNVRSSLSYDSTVEENTLTAYFTQKMFTASVVLPQTPSDFFSSSFTEERLNEQIDLGRIGPNNPPTYISNIVYGRMLMLTMTSTYSVEDMQAALSASRASIGSGSIDGSHLTVLENSEIRVSTVGGVDDGVENLISTGQLGQYFAADAPLTSARPLSYTVRNLADNSIAKVSETTEYAINSCTAEDLVPTGARYSFTVDKLRLISDGCDGLIGPSPEVYYSFSLIRDSGTTVIADRSADDYVVLSEGGEVNINSAPRFASLYANGDGTLRMTGTAWDYDSGSADEVMGNWDLSWNYGVSNGQRYFTRSGGGCSIRVYVSINKVNDLYD